MSHIATCGHEIDEGISCSIDEGQIFSDGHPAISYGTYCPKCMFDYFEDGSIENKEMNDFIMLIIKWAAAK